MSDDERAKEKQREYNKRYRAENKDKIRKRRKEYQEKNKEILAAKMRQNRKENPQKYKDIKKRSYDKTRDKAIARSKAYNTKNRDRVQERKRKQEIRKKYGISKETFDQMLLAQDNRCKCCNTLFGILPGIRPSIDHCHSTGVVRGILCSQCNVLLGHASDDPQVLRRCADYLESQGLGNGVANLVSRGRKKKGVKDDSSNDVQHVLFSEGSDAPTQLIVGGTGEGSATVDREVSSETAA